MSRIAIWNTKPKHLNKELSGSNYWKTGNSDHVTISTFLLCSSSWPLLCIRLGKVRAPFALDGWRSKVWHVLSPHCRSHTAMLVHHKNNICMWIKNKWWQWKKYWKNIIKNTITADRLVGSGKKCDSKKAALKIMKQPRVKLMRLRKWKKKGERERIYSIITSERSKIKTWLEFDLSQLNWSTSAPGLASRPLANLVSSICPESRSDGPSTAQHVTHVWRLSCLYIALWVRCSFWAIKETTKFS